MVVKNLKVIGMHCASCSQVISQQLQKLPQIKSAYVNFASEEARIEYDPGKISINQINKILEKFGYSLIGEDANNNAEKEDSQESLIDDYKNKVLFSFPVTIVIFFLMMWDVSAKLNDSLPRFPIPMHLFDTIMFVLASIILFWIGKNFLIGILRFAQHRVANMDTLIGIGTFTAYIYSSFVLLFSSFADALNLPDYTYFDVTVVVIGFVILGKYLEIRSKAKTNEAIVKLLGLSAKTARIIRNGKEIEIPIEQVSVGDLMIVRSGEKIPTDGVITDGTTSVDESMVNGEPIPKDKKKGDSVIGATINRQGAITVKAQKVGNETMLSQIIKMVQQAQNSKTKIQTLIDRISSIFVPVVLIIAILSLIAWLTIGTYFLGFDIALSYGLLSFVGVLIIACPCALGLATPTAIVVGVGRGAQQGILVKDAQSLETLSQVKILVFDKTGTITEGKPVVTDILSFDKKYTSKDLIQISSSIEKFSSHPLASAVVSKAYKMKINFLKVVNYREVEGSGVQGIIKKQKVIIRKPKKHEIKIDKILKLQKEGKTIMSIEVSGRLLGALAVSDLLKKDVDKTILQIHNLGIKTLMLTGDNQISAKRMAETAGISEFKANVLPQGKAKIIQHLQKSTKVAMVGDGINDAPALAKSDVGIAMSTGTDIAIESADITLLHGDIKKILSAIRLSKFTLRTIKQNLFWAFIYNVIGIPLAAGLFYPFFQIILNPIFAGAAMALSSISVVGNSLILKKIKL